MPRHVGWSPPWPPVSGWRRWPAAASRPGRGRRPPGGRPGTSPFGDLALFRERSPLAVPDPALRQLYYLNGSLTALAEP